MTSRNRYGLAAVATSFLLVLLFATFRSTSTPLQLAPEARESARRACYASVVARLPGARFPHDPSMETRPTGQLFLSGSVDAGGPSQSVRRNYECVLRRDPSGAFVAESVSVWQSH